MEMLKVDIALEEMIDVVVALENALAFARDAIANDGKVDSQEAVGVLLHIERAYAEAIEAKVAVWEASDAESAAQSIKRGRGFDYSDYHQDKLERVNLRMVRARLGAEAAEASLVGSAA